MRNGIFSAQGSKYSAVLFVAGDNKMKDHTNRTNTIRRAHKMFMALLIALTMMISAAVQGVSAFAANNNDTVRVATYDQLQEALEETKGVKEIVVDPQAAVDEGEVVYSVEGDENNNAFYIGFDEALTVSDDITITSADDVDVYFARSDSFRNDQDKPALLNIESEGKLNLDGFITMTGEEVATTFYEANEVNPAEFVFSVKSKDGTGEDNEVWNSDQALKGGFYIQNNGGEYTLGDDVVMKDINLADDVEDAEQIHEEKAASSEEEVVVEKSTDAAESTDSSETSDVEKEATEEAEKTETEETTEEAPVISAPKRFLMGLKSSPAQRSGGAANVIDSLEKLEEAARTGGTYTVTADITLKKQIEITKNLTLIGEEGSAIRRGVGMGYENWPMFKVAGGTLKLDGDLKLSGIPGIAEATETTYAAKKTETFVPSEEQKGYMDRENNPVLYAAYLPVDGEPDKFWALPENYSGKTSVELVKVSREEAWSLFQGGADSRLKWILVKNPKGQRNSADNNHYYYSLVNAESYMNSSIDDYYFYKQCGTNKYKAGKLNSDKNIAQGYWGASQGESGAEWHTYFYSNNVSNSQQDYKFPSMVWMPTDITRDEFVTYYDTGLPTGKTKTQTKSTNPNHLWKKTEVTCGDDPKNPKAFFVQVDGGKLELSGNAKITEYTTVKNYNTTPRNHAPVVVVNGEVNMNGGEISGNTVGYCPANDIDFNSSIQWIKTTFTVDYPQPTNTAGGIYASGSNAKVNMIGDTKISGNRADAGAIIITNGAKVTMDKNENGDKPSIDHNVGWHHAGGILTEDGATLHLKDGKINDNIAWGKGGAVWATEWGTTGWVQWDPYPTAIKNIGTRKAGGNFIMDGGELKNNFANARAGAIEVESNGVQLNGGVIDGNKCKSLGGAIYVEGDASFYTYTLVIKNGFISGNEAVMGADSRLDKGLNGLELENRTDRKYNPYHYDNDFARWDADGNGGGVWLCPMGGTSVFTSNSTNAKVIIDENKHGRSGQDFFVSGKKGSAIVHNIIGDWFFDSGEALGEVPDAGRIITGSGMYNGTDPKYTSGSGIQITNNVGRDGGGIAANGTIVLGEPENIYRYEAELELDKTWEDGLTPETVKIDLYYTYNGKKYKLNDEEISVKEGKVKITLPAYKQHTDSNGKVVNVPIFEITDPNNTNRKLDLANNKEDIQKLYEYIDDNSTETTPARLDISWNIEVSENPDTYKPIVLDTNGKATARVANKIVLGDDGGTFYVYFSNITVGQKVKNTPRTITLDKVGPDGTAITSGGSFKLFKVGKNNGNDWDFVVDQSKEPSTGEWVGGKLKFTTTGGSGYYFLVEESAPSSYVRPVDPWLIKVNDDDTVSVYTQTGTLGRNGQDGSAAGYHYDKTQGKAVKTEAPSTYNKAYFNNKVWPEWYFSNTAVEGNKVVNKKATVELIKTDGNGTRIEDNASFAIYEASHRPDQLFSSDGTPKTGDNDIGIKKNNEVALPAVNSNITTSDGRIVIDNLDTDKMYLLFEKNAPEGYKRAKTPWLIWVKSDGTYRIFKYKVNKLKAGSEGVQSVDRGTDVGWTEFVKHIDQRWYPTRYNFGQGSGSDGFNYYELTGNDAKKLKNTEIKIEFEKVDRANNSTKLNNVEFELYHAKSTDDPTTDGYIYKIDPDNSGKIATVRYSEDAGKYVLPVSEPGVYLLFETKPEPGYVKPKAPWGVWIDADGDVRAYRLKTEMFESYQKTYAETTDLKDIEVLCTDVEQLGSGILENDREPIEITKAKGSISNGMVVYEEPKVLINGAAFSIYKAPKSGDKWTRGDLIDDELKSVNGIIKLPSSISTTGISTVTDATADPDGIYDYWLEEDSPAAGYEKSQTPWIIRVKNGKLNEVYRFDDYVADSRELSYTNRKVIYSDNSVAGDQGDAFIHNEPVKIYKTAVDENVFLPNAKFKAFGVEEGSKNYVTNSNKFLGDLESKERGIIDISEIVKNNIGTANTLKFLVFEDEAPSGYKLVSTPWLITVTKNGGVTVTQYSKVTAGAKAYPTTTANTFWNKSLFTVDMPKKNLVNISEPLEFKKVDASTKIGIKGVEFELYYINYDRKTDSYSKSTQFGGKIYSDANGTVKITNLPSIGDYQFLLFETEAANGYIRDFTPWYVQIKYGYNENTGKNEMHIEYIQDMREEAKGNYTIDSTSWSRTDFCEPTSAQIENTKVYDLPNAGGMGTYWFMIIGAMMMGFALTAGFTKMNLLKLLRR